MTKTIEQEAEEQVIDELLNKQSIRENAYSGEVFKHSINEMYRMFPELKLTYAGR